MADETRPGSAVPTVIDLAPDEVKSAYWRWMYRGGEAVDDRLAIFEAGWRAGGRGAIRNSARLSAMVPLMREFLALIDRYESDDEAP